LVTRYRFGAAYLQVSLARSPSIFVVIIVSPSLEESDILNYGGYCFNMSVRTRLGALEHPAVRRLSMADTKAVMDIKEAAICQDGEVQGRLVWGLVK